MTQSQFYMGPYQAGAARQASPVRALVKALPLDPPCGRHHSGVDRFGCSMLRRVVLVIAVIGWAATLTGGAEARRRQINPIPFSHTPCSVLDGQPCTPSYCSVFNHGPCIPEIDYPYGQNLQLTVESVPPQQEAGKYVRPGHELDSIADLFAALRACWSPPPAEVSREGMQMSVRFSFKRSGEMIASPRVTFATTGVPAETRATYLNAIKASLDSCLPLRFSQGLGGALAGRPIAIRYVDNRALDKTSRPQ
jgi:hypothetical protein